MTIEHNAFLTNLKERKESKQRRNDIKLDIIMLGYEISHINNEIKELEQENKYISWVVGD